MTQKIVIDPKILAGKPIVAGTRIPVYFILNLLAHGYTFAKIKRAYPELTTEGIEAAIDFAESRLRYEEILPLKIRIKKSEQKETISA